MAEWLKRTQGKALEEEAARAGVDANEAPAPAPAASSSSKAKATSKTENKNLAKLKADLTELEDYIPWNAVVPSWGNRRSAWARKVRECPNAWAVAKQVLLLEQALVSWFRV